jgi:hypothetical protein
MRSIKELKELKELKDLEGATLRTASHEDIRYQIVYNMNSPVSGERIFVKCGFYEILNGEIHAISTHEKWRKGTVTYVLDNPTKTRKIFFVYIARTNRAMLQFEVIATKNCGFKEKKQKHTHGHEHIIIT